MNIPHNKPSLFNRIFSAIVHKKDERARLLELLEERGFSVQAREGEIVDRTGLIALAGTLKAIRNGKIVEGGKVLCCLTSGTARADGKAVPEYRVSSLEDLVKDCRGMIYGG